MKKTVILVLALLMVLSIAAVAAAADTVVYAGTQQYLSLVPFLNPKTYTAAVFEPLGSFTTYGADFVGIMMESWEYDGDRTYTVKLYDNIHDSAGNPIKAEDVVFCYAYEQVGSSEQANVVRSIESVTALDDLTVQFVWAVKPVIGAFEHALSYVNIVSKAAYEASGDGMATNPTGTGPYVVDSWTSGVTMTLKKNDNYWATSDQVKLPRQQQPVDTIVINTISETSQLTMALQTDTIDMTADMATQDVPNFEEGGAYASKYTVEKTLATAPKSLLVNHSPNAKTSDPNLRMAIMTMIDQELIAWMVNGGSNVAAYGFGSPMNPDYDEEAFKSYVPAHDVNKAKEYLKKSAYPNGCEINLIFIDGGMANDIAELIQGQLAEIGIKVNIKGSIFPNWLAAKNDETAWDLNLSELSGFYVTDLWESAFIKQNETFATEEELAELKPLVEAALGVETHSQETVNAAQKYITENVFVVPLLVEEKYNVYDSALIDGIAYTGEGAVCVQGFSYK
ncbi:MAG: ABC transporter substrate-binding protein [Anaerolineaceae bacterium]|nr:ABC transporter substrate-binding protein [Anaerolineaceae bacterium]